MAATPRAVRARGRGPHDRTGVAAFPMPGNGQRRLVGGDQRPAGPGVSVVIVPPCGGSRKRCRWIVGGGHGWFAQGRGGERTHALGEGDLRPEPQIARGLGGRCEHMTNVAEAVAADHLGPGRASPPEAIGERVGHLAHRVRLGARDIERPVGTGFDREHVRSSDVGHVHEVPHLTAVLEHAWRFASLERAANDARDPRVRRVTRHARPVDIVISQRGDARSVLPRERGAQVFLVQLRRGVHVARVERRVLRDLLGDQGGAAPRARRLERPASRSDSSRSGAHRPVLRAPVPSFAVHHHAARQHDGPTKPSS